MSDSVGNKASTFSLSGATTAVGTFAETLAGSALTETFIAQSSWNGDKMDGTGPSGVTLDPTKLNVFQIKIQYLGAGAITFEIEHAPAGNNPDFIVVHAIQYPNNYTITSFGNPSFPFTMSAYSAGSTTNLSMSVGSYAGFIEGQKKLQGNRYSYTASSTATTSADYDAIFTITNARTFKTKTNQSVINLLDIHVAQDHTRPTTFYIIKNATLLGTPNFARYTTNSSALYDSAATTCTFSDNKQIIWTATIGDAGNANYSFSDDITIQPGESLTFAARSTSAAPTVVAFSANTREDQ